MILVYGFHYVDEMKQVSKNIFPYGFSFCAAHVKPVGKDDQ